MSHFPQESLDALGRDCIVSMLFSQSSYASEKMDAVTTGEDVTRLHHVTVGSGWVFLYGSLGW